MPMGVLLKLAFLALSSGMLFGIDLAAIGGGLEGMSESLDLSTVEQEAVVAGAKAGSVFGALLGGALMAVYGRRTTIFFSVLPFFLGPLAVGLAPNFAVVFLGRLLMGLGVGIASVATTCYLSEVAPHSSRGGLVSLYELAIAFGFVITTLLDYVIEKYAPCTGGCWRYQTGLVPLVAATPLLFATLLVAESPRWLLAAAGGDSTARLTRALKSLVWLGVPGASLRLKAAHEMTNEAFQHAGHEEDELLDLWDQHYEAAGRPFHATSSNDVARTASSKTHAASTACGALFRTLGDSFAVIIGRSDVPKGSLRGLWLALTAAFLDQVCASTSILLYSQHLLKEAGIKSSTEQDLLTTLVAVAKFIGVGIGLLIVNKVDRRPLLGWGGILSAITLTVLAIGAAYRHPVVLLIGMCSYIIAFCSTWANGYWIVATEVTTIAGPRFGSACQALATAVLFASGSLSSFTFLWVMQSGRWGLMIYAVVGVVMALFSWVLLPETRGLVLEDCGAQVAVLPIERWFRNLRGVSEIVSEEEGSTPQ